MTRLRYRAEINPDTPAFSMLPDDTEIAFLPLEAVWADARLDVSRRRSKNSVSSGYTRFQSGDVIVPKITPTFQAGRANIVPKVPHDVAAGTTELHIVRPVDIDVGYLRYLMHTSPFLQGGVSEMKGVAGQKRVPDVWLRDMPVPVDNSTGQQKIADFLDRETERIDALVDKKRRLIDLLEEKRTATITQAVTKGLDPTAPMKPSNIPWIGEIPAHWDLTKFGYLLQKIGSGKTPKGGANSYVDEGVTFLRSQNIHFDGLRLKGVVHIADEVDKEMSSSRVSGGDVLLNITGASIGRATVVPVRSPRMNVNQHVSILRPIRAVHAHWIHLWLWSRAGQVGVAQVQGGAARDGLSSESIGGLAIALPPENEQQAIVAAVASASGSLSSAAARLTTQLSLLVEYREALITAAVTGEIDVDEHAKAVRR